MLDQLIGGYGHRYGHKDHRSGGYGFEEHKEFVSHEESEGGYFDRQARYDHHMRLPANHGRPPMAHMPVCDEDDEESDVEEFFESNRSHHNINHNLHHQQPPPLNFMPPPSGAHHKGKMGNGWQGRHEDAYHGGHGMQHHGAHGMQHQGGQKMQHHGGYEMQHHGAHGMQHHGAHGMQHHGGHEMQHHGAHGMQHHGGLMVPQVPPQHAYMSPNHGSGGGHAVVVKASEKWRVSNSSSGHHKAGWGSKGL